MACNPRIALPVTTFSLLGLLLPGTAESITLTGNIVLEAPPVSVVLGATESNITQRLFLERSAVTLAVDLDVDITTPDTYTTAALSSGTIDAGTMVRSYFLHLDSVGDDLTTGIGAVTFDHPILGVIVESTFLDLSDATLGSVSTIYPLPGSDLLRGIESGGPFFDDTADPVQRHVDPHRR